jgi:ABC-type lipoprotein export system ATPase subunit
VTALVATHDPNLISIADDVLELEDGKIKPD